jgi:hypothetical protein
MADPESPFIKLLPPATDYVTYLTFIEHNLTEEHLPVLHEVLQNSELTINIGWVSVYSQPHTEALQTNFVLLCFVTPRGGFEFIKDPRFSFDASVFILAILGCHNFDRLTQFPVLVRCI